MPDFIKAYDANKDQFAVIGVNWNDEPALVKQFVKDSKINFPVTIDDTGDLITLYRAKGHPTSIFIDRNGVISSVVPGMVTPEALDEQLRKLLK